MPTHLHDIAIVGAGPAGSAAAYFLAQRGLDVLLLDKADFPRDKTCGDGLSPRALVVLDAMGLLPDLQPHGRRVNRVRLFSPDSRTVEAAVSAYPGLPEYAFVIPRFRLDDLIRQRAVKAGAQFVGGFHVQDVRREGEIMEIVGQGGRHAVRRARFAILATGASVALLQKAGILKKAPPFMVAARAYYEDIRDFDGQIDFHFDGVPLPGYGWVFPISETSANVGAGYFRVGRRGRAPHLPSSPKAALDQFLTLPHLRQSLNGARQVGPAKGFPLRVDFATAPTFGEGLLLAGEACGLVNPLTGEGIDYSLESGQIAAEFIAENFARGREGVSRHVLKEYDRRLRRKFQRLFVFSARMRDVYMTRPWFLNRLLGLALRRPDLKVLLVDIALGNRDAAEGTSLKTILNVLVRKA